MEVRQTGRPVKSMRTVETRADLCRATRAAMPRERSLQHCLVHPCFAGPGTLHAALRVGKPNCIVSFVCDNPFWGDRLQNMLVRDAAARSRPIRFM